MNVAVLLRVLDDPELAAGVSHNTLRLDDSALVALGMALPLRQTVPGARLSGIAAGPESWDRPLQEALAAGLDSVARAWSIDLVGADVPATAAALAGALGSETALVLCGAASTDHGSGTLPGAIAELLGLPLLSDVATIGASPDGLVAQVRGDGGRRRTYRVPSRAVLVAARLAAPAIFPPVARRLAARRAAVPETAPASTGLVSGAPGRMSLIGFGPARPLTRHLIKPSASAAPADRIRQLMSGGMSGRGGQTIDTVGAGGGGLAKQLAEILEKQGFLV